MSLSVVPIAAIVLAATVVLLLGVVLIMLCTSEKSTNNVETKKEEGKVTLNILVRCGRILQKQDVVQKGDPYVVLKFNGQEKKTVVLKDTFEPQWNEEFSFSNAPLDSVDGIKIELWDEHSSEDEIIGSAVITDLNQYADYADGKRHNHTLVIMNDQPTGVAELDVEVWANIEKGGEDAGESEKSETEGESEKQTEDENENDSIQVEDEIKIVLVVKGAKIHESHDEGSKDDPFVQLKVGDVTRKSATAINTQTPVWNESFTFEKVKSSDADSISVTLWDSDVSQSELVGSAEIALLQYKNRGQPVTVTVSLLDKEGTEQAVLEIEVVVEGTVAKANDDSEVEAKAAQTSRTLSTQRTNTSRRTNATHKSSTASEGKVVLTIRNGKINKAHDEHSKDDPFVEVKIGDVIKKTATLLDTQSPVWDETLTFERVKSTEADKVSVTLWEADLTQNQLIGNTKLSLLQYKGRGEPTHVLASLYDDKGVEQAVLEIDVTVEIADVVVSRSIEGGSKTSRTNATHQTSATHKTDATHAHGHSGGGTAVLKVKSGKILSHHDEHSKDDPFAEIKIGDTIKKTATLLDTQTPTWNDTLTFEKVRSSDAEKVSVSVWDADARQNQLVGNTKFSLAQYKGKGPAQVSLSLVDDKGVEQGTIELEVVYEESGAATSRTSTTHHTHHTERESRAGGSSSGGDVKSRELKSPGTSTARTQSSKSPVTERSKGGKSPETSTARTGSKSPTSKSPTSRSPTSRADSKSPTSSRTESKSPTSSRSNAAKGSDTWTEYARPNPADNTGTEVTVVYEGQRKKKKVPKGNMTVDNTNTEWLAYLVDDGRKHDRKHKAEEDK